jgi:hypothetical protein
MMPVVVASYRCHVYWRERDGAAHEAVFSFDDHLARAAGGVGGEEGPVGGDAAPALADGAAAEHGHRVQADKDVGEVVVAKSVDAATRHLHHIVVTPRRRALDYY